MTFGGALALIFIVLKLVGFVDWSWLWVLSPLWLGFIFWFVIFTGLAVFTAAKGSK